MDVLGVMLLNGDSDGDSPISVVYENPNIPHEEPLDVNGLIPNMVVLSDMYGIGRGFIKSGGDPFIPSYGNEQGYSRILDYIEVVAPLTSSVWDYKEMEVTLTSQNEIRILYFS